MCVHLKCLHKIWHLCPFNYIKILRKELFVLSRKLVAWGTPGILEVLIGFHQREDVCTAGWHHYYWPCVEWLDKMSNDRRVLLTPGAPRMLPTPTVRPTHGCVRWSFDTSSHRTFFVSCRPTSDTSVPSLNRRKPTRGARDDHFLAVISNIGCHLRYRMSSRRPVSQVMGTPCPSVHRDVYMSSRARGRCPLRHYYSTKDHSVTHRIHTLGVRWQKTKMDCDDQNWTIRWKRNAYLMNSSMNRSLLQCHPIMPTGYVFRNDRHSRCNGLWQCVVNARKGHMDTCVFC